MTRETYIYDGSVKTLSLRDSAGWRTVATTPESAQMDTARAYATVPMVFRCASIRCAAVRDLPFVLMRRRTDITDSDEGQRLALNLRRQLWNVEAALCFYGACYLLPVENKFGRNPALQWFVPSSIVPQYDPAAPTGVAWFDRYTSVGSHRYQPDVLIHIWLPSLVAEVGPGVAPARAALGAAGVLAGLDAFATQFFERGAVKATLLTVEGNPPKAEMDKLEAWWKRLVAGVRNAWQTVAIRAGVKPVVIGDGLKELESDKLIAQKREDIGAAFGVPLSLIQSNASTFATAQADRLNFYDLTVVPQCRFLEDELNAQYYDRLGLRLRFAPERLELYQGQELQKAEALFTLTGKPLLTVNEARARLELDPLPDEDADRMGHPPSPEPRPMPDAPDLDIPDAVELRSLLNDVKALIDTPSYRDSDDPAGHAGNKTTPDASGETPSERDCPPVDPPAADDCAGDFGRSADRPEPAAESVATDSGSSAPADGTGSGAAAIAAGSGLDGAADRTMGDKSGDSPGDRPDGDDTDAGAAGGDALQIDAGNDTGVTGGDVAASVRGGPGGDDCGDRGDTDGSSGGDTPSGLPGTDGGDDDTNLAHE